MSTFGCPHCGHSNPIVVHFCAHCGTNLQKYDTYQLLSDIAAKQTEEEPADGNSSTEPTKPDSSVEPAETDAPSTEPKEQSTPPLHPPDSAEKDLPPAASTSQPGLQPRSDPSLLDRDGPPEQLLTDLQNVLEPAHPLALVPLTSDPADMSNLAVSEAERRRLREMFSAELPSFGAGLGRLPSATTSIGRGLSRRPWLEWLLLLGLTAALLLPAPSSDAAPHIWPGVVQAYQYIETLPPNSSVLVNWAYDPATGGEMDIVARPVIEHLLHKQAQLIVVSQLPAGLASARRLIAKAGTSVAPAILGRDNAIGHSRESLDLIVRGDVMVEGGFFPGGAASLPLLGVAPAESMPIDPGRVTPNGRASISSLASEGPALHLLIAARSQDVQRWLEQVQPLHNRPLIAVTSAAVDPAVRPYWDSGQLAGLVSGWDGGIAYQRQSVRPQSNAEQGRSLRQIAGHNWGFGILFTVIVLGNLAVLAERRLT